MEIFENIQAIYKGLGSLGINYQIVIMILLGGIFAQTYFRAFTHIGPFKIDAAWRTLIVGTAFVFGLVIFKAYRGPLPKEIWEEYFISYIFSTSLYEIDLKRVFNSILIKFGIIKSDNNLN